MEAMEDKSNIQDALILSNEISSLFIEYFIKPWLLRSFGSTSWDEFTNKLSELETTLDETRLLSIDSGKPIDDEQLYAGMVSFLEPLQRHIPISVSDIRFLRNDRASLTHIRHKSVAGQLALVDQAKKFEFFDRFVHNRSWSPA